MKQFWNWKTALMGILTALILASISAIAFATYCQYLRKNEDSSTSMTVEVNGDGEEQSENVVVLKTEGETAVLDATPTLDMLRHIYCYHYVLYKDLCDRKLSLAGQEPYFRYEDLIYPEMEKLEVPSAYQNEDVQELQSHYENIVSQARQNVESRLESLEYDFASFNEQYDYWIVDGENISFILSNREMNNIDRIDPADYAFLFQVNYDEHGVPTIAEKNLYSGNPDLLRKNVNSVLHEKIANYLGGNADTGAITYSFLRDAIDKALIIKRPVNCTIVIGITWEKYHSNFGYTFYDSDYLDYFRKLGTLSVKAFCFAILGIAALCGALWLNPGSEEKRKGRILAKAPLELVIALILLIYSGEYVLHSWMTDLCLGMRVDYVSAYLFVFFICLIAWYVGGCAGEVRILGIWGYLKKRCLLLIVGAFLWKRCRKIYREYQELNLGMNLRGKILRLVLFNALIVSVCCCGWFFGIIGVIIYSVCLFFLAMQYVTAVQKDYQKLQRMTMEMSEGNLKYEPEESLGLFEPVKEDLVQIRNGFDKAVQEEVKSHKMKTELITNVSHDLKTPLTAIITYVNLLKEKNLTEEQREQYVNTLDQKSLRLKRLIEDLFEVSKANSGNVQLNLQNCDLANLIKQCYYENKEKLEEKNLTTRLSFPEEKVVLKLDSEKTYRIYENLFNNIAKYAMPGTRVYVTMTDEKDRVIVSVKNITEAELYVPAEELAERFVRGDASRGSVEGSGLGLAIVRSFTEIQGGKLDLEIDGDLFKVTTIWRKP